MISCIVTTYKREPETLRRALLSVIKQTFNDIEIIVVNDAPHETELEHAIRSMIDSLEEKRILYILHENSKGACVARNTGAAVAKGDYIAFLDDDDEWLPEKLEKQMLYMTDNSIGLVSCDVFMIKKNCHKVRRQFGIPTEGLSAVDAIMKENCIGGASFPLLRKDMFLLAGQFDPEMKSSQDTDMWIRMLQVSEFRHCSEPLVNYYVSSESISLNVDAKKQGYDRLLKKYADYYQAHPAVYRNRLLMIGYGFVVFGHTNLAKGYFCEAQKNGSKHAEIVRLIVKGRLVCFRKKMWGY